MFKVFSQIALGQNCIHVIPTLTLYCGLIRGMASGEGRETAVQYEVNSDVSRCFVLNFKYEKK